MNRLQKAQRAWTRTGRPFAEVEKMSQQDISALAKLTDDDGNAVDGFREKFDEWRNDYLERNKASEEELTPPQKTSPKNPKENEPEEPEEPESE